MMNGQQLLYQELETFKKVLPGKGQAYKQLVPAYVQGNLASKFKPRPYQQEAFGRFIYYFSEYDSKPEGPIQNLFHMATGSGKTLIMAGLMLYLYQEGYRNFLFFVDSSNIIDKTRHNFLDPVSSKYLFADRIQIEDRQVRINEVDNFSSANEDNINVVFTTIQGLHSRLNNPRENAVTFEDFENHKVVLLSDEAHHINAETKTQLQRNKSESRNLSTWEGTINTIVNAHPGNVMLEFTATMDMGNDKVKQKYKDRILFDYPLKEFRIDGYSKEVNVLQADLDPVDRALQAVVLSQYRLKKFAEYGIAIKPVIMFKANYVNPPKQPDKKKKVVSSEFREAFLKKMRNLSARDLQAVKNRAKEGKIIYQIFSYFEKNGITLSNLASELRGDFIEEKCISVDSINDKEENQIRVNSLEDADNPIRVVFAVDALNEGWDVLNLFDIVRLYDTRDAKKGKPGKTTMAEAQLIGRGARYCPFKIKEDQPLYKRKYDITGSEEEHELKICEELYYHSAHNPRYIDELHTALEEIGIKAKRSRQISLNLKPSFKETATYKEGKLFVNERKKYNREDIKSLDEHAREHLYKVELRTGYMMTTKMYDDIAGKALKKAHKDFKIASFGTSIVRKALNRLQFYRFNNLKKYFPYLKSQKEFVESENYLARLEVEVTASAERLQNLTPDDKLDITVQVLDDLASKIKAGTVEYKGTKTFEPRLLKDVIGDKKIRMARESDGDQQYGESQIETTNGAYRLPINEKEWYVFADNLGTSEEKSLVRFIDKTYSKLKKQYDEIYLIRNEQLFKVYNFEDGKGFAPDFVLFLKTKKPKEDLHYQIFIEPKGDHLLEHDAWKEEFLKGLKGEVGLEQIWKGKEYNLWGLPFYNENKRRRVFQKAFDEVISGEDEVEYEITGD
jgi:type III restriction enzyme